MNKGIKPKSNLFSLGASVLCLILSSCSLVHGQRYQDFITPTPLKEGDFLIVGFMGGRVIPGVRRPGRE